jgi:hypothetical protein
MSARILVTGSRDWVDSDPIYAALQAAGAWLHARGVWRSGERSAELVLVHGDARGLDRMAADIATSWGWTPEPHAADWNRHGNAAGPIRNAEMVALGADICLAFPFPRPAGKHGKSGTEDCYTRALAIGIPTFITPGVPGSFVTPGVPR